MLVRGGMENKFGAVVCEDRFQARSVAHRGNLYGKVKLSAIFAYKLLLNIVCVVFVDIEDNKLFGLAFCYLTAKLAADRAAAARYENGFAGLEIKFLLTVYGKRLSEKQVFDLKFTNYALLVALAVHRVILHG